jgi:hypothetical protein
MGMGFENRRIYWIQGIIGKIHLFDYFLFNYHVIWRIIKH